MLSTEEFAEWSKKVVLFLHNTSRCEDEPYPNLLREKGGNGFPTVSYLDADGKLLKQVGHITPVEELEAAFQELDVWRSLRDEVEDGNTARRKELFLMELGMRILPYDQAQKTCAALQFDDAEKAKVDQELINLQFTEILRATPAKPAAMAESGAKFLEMFRAMRIPTTSQDTSFWQFMFAHAGAQGDVGLFEELMAFVKNEKADDPRLQRYLPRLERQLEQLKQKKGSGG